VATNATLHAIRSEVLRARAKFPKNRKLLAALTEEVGEVARALLQDGNGQMSRDEAVQVAAIAVRIIEEGDADFDNLSNEERQP
jgi:NTP pyrophosphatase (non-canonical NTP hydrolase)